MASSNLTHKLDDVLTSRLTLHGEDRNGDWNDDRTVGGAVSFNYHQPTGDWGVVDAAYSVSYDHVKNSSDSDRGVVVDEHVTLRSFDTARLKNKASISSQSR